MVNSYQRELHLDSQAIQYGRLKMKDRNMESFSYWHDRPVILKEVFDDAEPRTTKQWWCDRWKRVQWYTLWVAALMLNLTIFFRLVQSIESGIQAYAALHPHEEDVLGVAAEYLVAEML